MFGTVLAKPVRCKPEPNSNTKESLMENVPNKPAMTSKYGAKKTGSAYLLGAVATATSLTLVPAGTRAADAPPPSRIDALFNLEFSNEYLTPRGMLVHDKGLTLQPLLIGLVDLYHGDSFINNVTFVPG